MSIGFGIFLMAVGAILAFGVRDRSGAVDLTVVGLIIMLAGAAGIWLSYSITNKRRRVESQSMDPAVEEEYRAVQEPAPGDAPSSAAEEPVDQATMPVAEVPRVATERHVDLDPAANGLQIEVPERRVPMRARPDRAVPARSSWSSRLRTRFQSRR
ncbi:DUF6458 family protein [Kribbella sp. NPDC051587]|uniref:DUF6458 family protein n=1 Tax=Kribbella sp. NPDC051587 TaxID=3364119 RepID=UPI00379B0C0D